MIRSELVNAIAADNPNLPLQQVELLVSAFFEEITKRLADGGRVEIRGFGSFVVRDRDPYAGRNPGTGNAVRVDAKRVPRFMPFRKLLDSVANLKD